MAIGRLRLTRAQLASFLNSHELIKQFEQLFQIVDEASPSNDTQGAAIQAGNADAAANEALSAIIRLAQDAGIDIDAADRKATEALDALGRVASALDLLAAGGPLAPYMAPAEISLDPLTVAGPAAPYIDLEPPEVPNELIDAPLALGDFLTLPKAAGKGIRVDKVSPSFGWHDLLGEPQVRAIGANDPTWSVYRGTIRQFQYSNVAMNETWYTYHIPHDYFPGSDLFVHVHWSQIVVDTGGAAGVPGNVKWYCDISYAKGHGTPGGAADAFTATITVSITQQGSTTQYGHMLGETIMTDNGAALINRSRIEPDGVILLRMYRNPADAADTLNQPPFVHYVDIHYQTTNIGTKQKAPNFYV